MKKFFFQGRYKKENIMTKPKTQKEITSVISKTKSALLLKIEQIANGQVDSQKISIQGMVDIFNSYQNDMIKTDPKEKKHIAIIDYFKKDVCGQLLGMTWEFFTKSKVKKEDLEKMSSEDRARADQNKIYKVGTLKGRTFLNFCKGAFFLKELNALYRPEPNKNGQLLIKMEAVRKLKKAKQQSFWDSKIDNTEYALFSYNDMIRAYLTLFGVDRENTKDKSKLYNLMQDMINYINGSDHEKIVSESFDVFLPDELNQNKTKFLQLVEVLIPFYSFRAEQKINGKNYDVISEKLFTEYKAIKVEVDEQAPQKVNQK